MQYINLYPVAASTNTSAWRYSSIDLTEDENESLYISGYYFILFQTLDLDYYFYYSNSIISIIFIGIYYTYYGYYKL